MDYFNRMLRGIYALFQTPVPVQAIFQSDVNVAEKLEQDSLQLLYDLPIRVQCEILQKLSALNDTNKKYRLEPRLDERQVYLCDVEKVEVKISLIPKDYSPRETTRVLSQKEKADLFSIKKTSRSDRDLNSTVTSWKHRAKTDETLAVYQQPKTRCTSTLFQAKSSQRMIEATDSAVVNTKTF